MRLHKENIKATEINKMSKNSNARHVETALQPEEHYSTAKYLAGNKFPSTFGSYLYYAKLVSCMAFACCLLGRSVMSIDKNHVNIHPAGN
jgi:hypothetical protein